MLLKTEQCRDCPAFHIPGFVEPAGTGVNGVLIVGAEPDGAAVQQGKGITEYSEAGSILGRACDLSSLKIEQFLYTNLLQCKGGDSRIIRNFCASAHLRPLVERLKPRMIVALGPEVALELTGLIGNKTDSRWTRGFIMDGINAAAGYPVKLTYDPAVIREGNMHLLGALSADLLSSTTQTKRAFRPEYMVGLHRAAEWLESVRITPGWPISYDIETATTLKTDEDDVRRDNDVITQIQFSCGYGNALIVPWSERAKQFTRVVFDLPHRKLNWNGWLFDDPKLRHEGVDVPHNTIDLMWMWHFIHPELPYNLSHCIGHLLGDQLPPWKHTMSADLQRYGGLDVDSLSRAFPLLESLLETEGLAQAYQTFIVQFWPVLREMAERGFPFNKERAELLGDWLDSEGAKLFSDIQKYIPNSLKNCHPKGGYKRKPKYVAGSFEERDGDIWAYDKEYDYWSPLEQRQFGDEERWVRVKPFLVTSSDQIKRYAAAQGHALYKVRDGARWKESTGKKELLKMAEKYDHAFYRTVVEYREIDKIKSTYLSWPVDEKGRVHAEFHFGPESGQIDTRSPNVNNVPKGTPLAQKVRGCVVAADGHLIAEIDVKGFHAKTLGFCARDPIYMQLASEDIHSFLAAHILRLPFADQLMDMSAEERVEHLAWVNANHKQVRNKKAKPCMHGLGFGMGANKLYLMNEDSFESKEEAVQIRDIVKSLFPRIFAWQDEIRNLAHIQRKLITEFGCIRRFYNVMEWDYIKGLWKPGTQAEECIAFPPSNLAHCHIKLAMMRLHDQGLLDKYKLINFIKDSLVFECPKPLIDECIANVKAELERPSTVLIDADVAPNGFWVGTDAEVGADWASMEAYK